MKYCLKCKRLQDDKDSLCKVCGGSLSDVTDDNEPVYLLSAAGFELRRVKAALEDGAVPCMLSPKKSKAPECNPVAKTDYDASECDVLVPYSAYEKAFDICVGVGAVKLEGEKTLEGGLTDNAEADNGREKPDEQFEKMSGAKRTTVRVVTAVLFLALVALAVFGTDAIMKLVMGLFNS